MKYLLLAPILFFAFAFTPEVDQKEKSPNDYSVSYCKPDPKLVPSEARIEFTFSSMYGIAAGDSILMSYNGTPKTLATDKNGKAWLTLKGGKYAFQFYLDSNHYEIYTDSIEIKAQHATGIDISFQSSWLIEVAEKPVIYVYPDVTKRINIQLDLQGQLGFTYPLYNTLNCRISDGWNFTADPNGTIHMSDKEYDYLFWDGDMKINMNNVEEQKGFIVEKDSLPGFFEAKLTTMGLTPRERQDFITYWCPRMQENEKVTCTSCSTTSTISLQD